MSTSKIYIGQNLVIDAVENVSYTKAETDQKIADKIADLIDSAPETLDTLSEIATALDSKADQTTTYTKTEVDIALGSKADQTTTYTKTEVDTALDTKPSSSDFDNIVKITQNDYDLIATPDPNTLYIITI